MYPSIISNIKERFFRQAWETVWDNQEELAERESKSITMNAFNHSISYDGYCPTITTRVDGFKTAVLIVEIK